MKPPVTNRTFPSVWIELDYLYSKVAYWLHERNSRFGASRFIKRLRRVLKVADQDNSEAIICHSCHALLAEFSKQWSKAAKFRRQEIKSCIRMHEISKHDDPKTKEYALQGLGHKHVAKLYLILEHNLKQSGKPQEAEKVAEEFHEYCTANEVSINSLHLPEDDVFEKQALAEHYLNSKNKKTQLKGLKPLRQAARLGDQWSQSTLGWMYELGELVPKSIPQAAKWYRMSADQGSASAQCNLGIILTNRKGKNCNLDEAIELFHKAALQGDRDAQYYLGLSYQFGRGAWKNLKKSFEWYLKAAENGDPESLFNVGSCYYFGYGTAVNKKEAVRWFRKSAKQGEPDAFHHLGYCNYYGIGTRKNRKLAVQYYQRAAKQNISGAQYNLGLCYLDGEGVNKNLRWAKYWFSKAAKQGDSEAKKQLSKI